MLMNWISVCIIIMMRIIIFDYYVLQDYLTFVFGKGRKEKKKEK